MLQDMRITRKFPLVMIVFALASALITGIVACYLATAAMEKQAKEKLFSLLESRSHELKNYFETIRGDVLYYSQSQLIKNSFSEFSEAWEKLDEKTRQSYLQFHYIKNNPYQSGQKSSLLNAGDGSMYSQVHEEYHTKFMTLISTRRFFYEFFLIDKNGNIIYSVDKRNEFATNLETDLHASVGLKNIYQRAMNNNSPGLVVFEDFSIYDPGRERPASFIASPVYDDDHQYLGLIAFQISIDELNNIMQATAGMGETGETYLVGDDMLMRSNSRFYQGRNIMRITVDTLPARRALLGEEGIESLKDYRDTAVFSAFKPIDFLGTQWALIAEIDRDEVLEPVYNLIFLLMVIGVFICIIISVLGYWFAGDLSRPIRTMTNIMRRLADNDLSVNVSVNERKDEVGDMAYALTQFKKTAIEKERMRSRLSYMANHDSLTELPNRDWAISYIESLIRTFKAEQRSFSVMFADLDGFKKVNDQAGHLVGDHLLRHASKRFVSTLYGQDVVARLGGDEFLVILPAAVSERDCITVSEKLLKAFSEPFHIGQHRFLIGVSIGATTFSEKIASSGELLAIADAAMYQAKARGKNTFTWTASDDGLQLSRH